MEVSLNHIYLLNKANKVAPNDPDLALLYVAIYSLSVFSCGVQRVKTKPFNPMLGETYDFYDKENGIKFFAEQVSHHPPIGASFIQNEQFEINFYLGVETKFTGNAVTSKPFAATHITLKSTGATFVYQGVTSVAHNILIGNRWVDIFGKVNIVELGSTRYCNLNCKECDFFSSNWHYVSGICYSQKKCRSYIFEGTWNDKILAQKVTPKPTSGGTPLTPKLSGLSRSKKEEKEDKLGKVKLSKSVEIMNTSKKDSPTKTTSSKKNITITNKQITDKNERTDIPNFDEGKAVIIWKNYVELCPEKPYDNWEMTKLAREAITFDEKYYIAKELLDTDSRSRPDRIAVENLDYETAETEKHKLEVEQRRQREERESKEVTWHPTYFENFKLENGIEIYKYKRNYAEFK